MSELRKDPVSTNWVVIAPDQEAGVVLTPAPRFETDADVCPFCPGHEADTGHNILLYRKDAIPLGLFRDEIHSDGNGNGDENGADWALRVIPNRAPALRTEISLEREGVGMFDRISGVGAHEIVIDSPAHSNLLHEFATGQVYLMVKAWRERLLDLKKDSRLRYISIFRNQGRRSGARLSHPHSQIIATPTIPIGIRNELAGSREYYEYKERCVFCDLIDQERDEKLRIVTQNRGFLAICPFASRHPFEVWLLPRVHSHDYGTISEEQLGDLAEILKDVSSAISSSLAEPDVNLILKSTPNPRRHRVKWTTLEEDYHWHVEIIPRIARPSGYEWTTGMFLNPTPPEEAAAYLRERIPE